MPQCFFTLIASVLYREHIYCCHEMMGFVHCSSVGMCNMWSEIIYWNCEILVTKWLTKSNKKYDKLYFSLTGKHAGS
jgi:hypothetical protein